MLKKKIMVPICVMLLATSVVVPVKAAALAANFSIESTVVADGVRLRRTPIDGTILELMYKGEKVLIDSENLYEQIGNAWMHVQRVQTGTIGYCDAHYVGY